MREALTDSVRAHLVADVPVSVFLSGGIDSAVAGGARARARRGASKASPLASRSSPGGPRTKCPWPPPSRRTTACRTTCAGCPRAEFAQDTPRILDAMDQPSIDGVNTWFASKAAAERGYKVVLSGVGGDELFCGYSSFARDARGRQLSAGRGQRCRPSRARCSPHPVPTSACVSSAQDGGPAVSGRLSGGRLLPAPRPVPAAGAAGPDRSGHRTRRAGRLGGSPPGMTPADARDMTSAVGLLESTCYLRNQLLRDSDWASMDHSLELRTPLVDARLLAELAPFVSRFKRGAGKALMSRSPRHPLPAAVTSRPKTGFGVPMARWLSEPPRWRPGSAAERHAARGVLGTSLGDHRHGRRHVMRVIHVVPAVSDEASGPSYSVVRLCEALIETGMETQLAALDWNPGSRSTPCLTTFPLGRGPRGIGASPQMRRWLEEQVASGRLDLIHNHSLWMMPNVYPGSVCRRYSNCRLVVSPRGTLSHWALGFHGFRKTLFWRLLQGPAVRVGGMLSRHQ